MSLPPPCYCCSIGTGMCKLFHGVIKVTHCGADSSTLFTFYPIRVYFFDASIICNCVTFSINTQLNFPFFQPSSLPFPSPPPPPLFHHPIPICAFIFFGFHAATPQTNIFKPSTLSSKLLHVLISTTVNQHADNI